MNLICPDCKNNNTFTYNYSSNIMVANCKYCNIQYSLDKFGLHIYFNYQVNCNPRYNTLSLIKNSFEDFEKYSINYNNLSYNKPFQNLNKNDFQNIINIGFKYYQNSIFE